MTIWTTLVCAALAQAGEETILKVDAAKVVHRVSPFLYGACIEDVNHEIYGGLYSQMIFGESFREPPKPVPLMYFTSLGGEWRLRGQGPATELLAGPGDGPKLIMTGRDYGDGEVSVEIKFATDQPGNAGLIVKVDKPEVGADSWTGYEVSLETSGHLVLGRHRRNWEPLRRIPFAVPVGRWIELGARMKGNTIEVLVDGKTALTFEDTEHPLAKGGLGLRTWQRPAEYRNFRVMVGQRMRQASFEPKTSGGTPPVISGMWGDVLRGSARGEYAIVPHEPFLGGQSQRVTFLGGVGEVGIEDRGLNRQGMRFVAGKPYEGYVWARSAGPTKVALALENGDGSRILAEKAVELKGGPWEKLPFAMTPDRDESSGRFAISLTVTGSIDIGHAFLQPGEWGRFKNLPVRKDVAEALVDQGITVLRYGGSMINHNEYRWKHMIGPRDRRPPTAGTWYPYSSNGWGIFDFLDFCEAANFLAIPAVNMGETPQDMADFVEYANGPADSEWGRRRAADGHPEPYKLKHVELGNEEAVNDAYFDKFRPIAEAMWAKDPALILIVGDFAYNKVIVDPYHFEGGAAANSLAGHKVILELAKSRGREVWFDIHTSTNQPPEPDGLKPERSYIEQLGKLVPGAKFKVVIFEYNSGNHAVRRGLSNALATNEVERIGDLLPIACAANCLQPDGQNDNAWDQGLLFLNPSKVWLQPPGHVLRMTRRHYQPLLVQSELQGKSERLSVNVKKSEDGKTLVLQVINWDDAPRPIRIEIEGFAPSKLTAAIEELSGPLDGVNTADQTDRIAPVRSEWKHEMKGGRASRLFPPRSLTLIRFD